MKNNDVRIAVHVKHGQYFIEMVMRRRIHVCRSGSRLAIIDDIGHLSFYGNVAFILTMDYSFSFRLLLCSCSSICSATCNLPGEGEAATAQKHYVVICRCL